ncbi:MAG TPA: hypothetical protein VLQ45_11400 [Thermoanaerobaculia bacterium]|nr:hypothetical protein [Thermoanaerobaculia bacterium]
MAKRSEAGGGRGASTSTTTPDLSTGTGMTGSLGAESSVGVSGVANTGTFGADTDLNRSGQGTTNWQAGQQNQQNQGALDQAKNEAKNLASEAKEQTKQVANQARDHVQELVGQQKTQAAERLGGLAGALREAGQKLQENEQNRAFGRYADQAAQQMDKLSTYLRDNDLRGFVRDTETMARRRPELFLGGTFLAGLMLARFLKASSPNQGYGGGGAQAWQGYQDTQRYGSRTYPDYGTATGSSFENRSSYTPERRDPDVAADFSGSETYNAPLAR